jgi:hypothetical protein
MTIREIIAAKRVIAEKSILNSSSMVGNCYAPCKDISNCNNSQGVLSRKLAFNANCDYGSDTSDSLSVINELSNSFVTPKVLNLKSFHNDAFDNGSDDDVVIVRPFAASRPIKNFNPFDSDDLDNDTDDDIVVIKPVIDSVVLPVIDSVVLPLAIRRKHPIIFKKIA